MYFSWKAEQIITWQYWDTCETLSQEEVFTFAWTEIEKNSSLRLGQPMSYIDIDDLNRV